MINAQIIPNAIYGIQNFIDGINAANVQGECSYTPKADFYELEDEFVLEVELPGVKKENLDIQLDKNIIKMKASRVRRDGTLTYERNFRLGEDIDSDRIKVSLENGILMFSLPKKQQSAVRKLEIA